VSPKEKQLVVRQLRSGYGAPDPAAELAGNPRVEGIAVQRHDHDHGTPLAVDDRGSDAHVLEPAVLLGYG
jgi:hypothetical protein